MYRTLDDIEIDRSNVLKELRERRFDAIVFGDIWNQFGYLVETLPWLEGQNVAIVDGADSPAPFPYAGTVWRVPAWWTLPRVHRRFAYFKRELTPDTRHYRSFRLLPRAVCGLLPPMRAFHPISFSIPAEKIVPAPPAKAKRFPAHIVDRELAELVGGQQTYAFASEAEYYRDLQDSRFGVTTKRSGWDCMRHYEVAANGAVPCFRDLDAKPATCAPHGLGADNCISYRSARELLERLDRLPDGEYARLQRGALAWAHANTTHARALELLAALARE
jgi:hypothetical protein